MRIEITKPKNYEKVIQLIEEQEWKVGELMFLVTHCFDLVLDCVGSRVKPDVLKLFGNRYGLVLSDGEEK